MKDKFILDACCGPRMMWFNKNHPNTIYQDIRDEDKGLVDNRPNREIKPDIIGDFRKMDFPDKSFKLIVWDPPHIIQKYNEKCRMIATYGCLVPETWQDDLKRGFNECWRVLEDYGVLIFKWSEVDRWGQRKFSAKLDDILKLFHTKPLFAQKVKWTKDNQFATFWCCFMKIPKVKNNSYEDFVLYFEDLDKLGLSYGISDLGNKAKELGLPIPKYEKVEVSK